MARFLKNIYLADDDSDDREFFQEAIAAICPTCRLDVSPDGEELLEKLQVSLPRPDIIFMDINMPKMDGLTALHHLREKKLHPNVPVVIYSTSSNEANIKSAKDFGANFYLVKPSCFIRLKEKIQLLLSPAGYKLMIQMRGFATILDK